MQDAKQKGRTATRGDLPQSKLSNEQVLEVIDRAAAGEKYRSIANDYDVTPQLIGKIAITNGIRRNKTWRKKA